MNKFYKPASMKKIGLCVLALIGLSSAIAQEKINGDKQIPILAWASFPAGESNVERLRELKEMRINISLSNYSNADGMQRGLDLAREVGIKMVSSCPELKTDVENTVKRFRDHPSLAGYFLRDEPVRKDFAEIGAWARKIEALDPKHFSFVNLMASIHTTNTDALGTDSYEAYVRSFAAEVPSQVLSFDFYPVLKSGVHESWYAGLEIFSAEAKKLEKPFWAFAL